MKNKDYISDKCEIKCEDNGKIIVAEILSFQDKKLLSVSLERSVKLMLHWNGAIYEGAMGKLSFTSNGPAITTVKIQR